MKHDWLIHTQKRPKCSIFVLTVRIVLRIGSTAFVSPQLLEILNFADPVDR